MLPSRSQVAERIARHAGLSKEEIEPLLEIPPYPALGHFALPCFRLAKQLKKAPQAIAQELAAALRAEQLVEKAEAAGAYLNLTLRLAALNSTILSAALAEDFGRAIQRKRILVEYMNANPNKPLHIGQARNVCI